MRWWLKAALQNAIAPLPAAHDLNYLLQHRVTRSLPSSDDAFRRKVAIAFQHYAAFREHVRELDEPTFYEFGAGWELDVPLAYYALGIDRQVLVDIHPNVRLPLVNDTIAKFARHREALEDEAGRQLRDLGRADVAAIAQLETRFGIRYLAPLDARATGLEAGSIDFISSTSTLEHIPEPDIALILRECARLLAPHGVISCRIDLRDHYSYIDARVSPYNFLKFSRRGWRLVNSSLHFQNRLRARDHLRLLEEAGFEIVEQRVAHPNDRELALLRSLDVDREFRGYSLEELGAKSLVVVARPRVSSAR